MVMANHRLARAGVALLARLGVRERARTRPRSAEPPRRRPDVLLLGFHRVASSLLHAARYERARAAAD